MLTAKNKQQIWYLYKNEHLSKKAISTKLGYSRNTVIKVLNEEEPKSAQFLKEIKHIQDEKNKELLELIKNDNRLPDTVNKILNAINNSEVIQNEVDKGNIKSLMTVVGVLTDKHIATKRLEQDNKRIALQARQIELKEKELEMRIANPDSFSDVVIINDVDQAKDYYKERELLLTEDVSKN